MCKRADGRGVGNVMFAQTFVCPQMGVLRGFVDQAFAWPSVALAFLSDMFHLRASCKHF